MKDKTETSQRTGRHQGRGREKGLEKEGDGKDRNRFARIAEKICSCKVTKIEAAVLARVSLP